ncbi:VirB3 family type IV secretion system protein [Paracoccus tegillarcae]|uniref:Type IV secretion system protein VirB3 n=1 Tax=Paracoccus tegillarcae TaxID=1529068 RepID=A0A2K9EQE7_9RHOB|nr:VirB3 family type IV secretion system protein [Paracoccus tegillarcae]AUH35707.1 hypothetical protein CUV01_19180 [Paracoccus tegillarcae]
MEQSVVILGLSRQARLAGLPMPYMLGVGALTALPFFWTQFIPWVLTGPLWYLAARVAVAMNPNGHKALAVVLRRTPPSLSRKKRKEGRRYV